MTPSLTDPPTPQRFFRRPARSRRPASSSGTSATVVTVLPRRPPTSRRTLTRPPAARRARWAGSRALRRSPSSLDQTTRVSRLGIGDRLRAPLAAADLDAPVAHARLEDWLRIGRRPALDGPVLEREAAAVQRALDAAVDEPSLAQRAASVRAAVGQRVDASAGAREHERDAVDLRGRELARAHVGVGGGVGPVCDRGFPRVLVDADAVVVGEVPAERAADAQRDGTDEAERLARRAPVAAPGGQRRAVEAEG